MQCKIILIQFLESDLDCKEHTTGIRHPGTSDCIPTRIVISVYFGPPCRGVQGGPDPPGSEIQISDPPGRTPLDPEGESSKSWIFVQICSKNNTNFDCRSTKYKIFRLRRADSDFSILNLSKSLIFKNQGGLGPPWI